jgi:hypothetical protein
VHGQRCYGDPGHCDRTDACQAGANAGDVPIALRRGESAQRRFTIGTGLREEYERQQIGHIQFGREGPYQWLFEQSAAADDLVNADTANREINCVINLADAIASHLSLPPFCKPLLESTS